MAIQRVSFLPQQQKVQEPSTLDTVSKVAQIAGPVLTAFGMPVAGALSTAGGLVGGMASSAQQPAATPQQQGETAMVSSAVDRRQRALAENPAAGLQEADAALMALNLPEDQKQRLRRPLLLAMQAQS